MIHDPQRNDETASGQGERVAKALARAGVASRREVERLIEAGRVALNGHVLTTPAVKVAPGDILTVDGKVVNEAEPARLFRYHKPVGLVTTHSDPQGRPTVFESLPPGLPRLISVGRLDLNSEGLLLLTNDGGLARALEMPETAIVRRYRVRARGRIDQARLDKLQDGITVEGVRYGAIEAKIDKAKDGPQGANLWISVTLAEGKNREIRRVFLALGLQVGRLIRLSYGPFALGTLESGQIEEVGPRVIREQLSEHIAPANLPQGDRPQWVQRSTSRQGAQRRAPMVGPRSETTPEGELIKKKPAYKAGWAKAKITPSPHKASPRKASPQSGRQAKPGPATIGPDRPEDREKRAARERHSTRDRSEERAKPTAREKPAAWEKPPGQTKPRARPAADEAPKARARPLARGKPEAQDRPRAHDKPKGPAAARDKPGPKGSGSPRADVRSPGPRGPTASAGSPQSSDARRPGPPKPGGPRRRG